MRSAKAVVTENAAAAMRGQAHSSPSRTITSLRRWSCINRELPVVSQVKSIHVYDFDNTLFLSPLPNPQLWNGPTIGFLQAYESFANGGWWHDPNLLAATGDGVEKEEPRAWEGWWNEQIVQLVRLSMEQKDALTVLLTGRSESGFSDLLRRMTESKKLDFDLVCLKPEVGPRSQRFSTTMEFKQTFLEDLVLTYEQAEEIRVYEDRVKHAKHFRDFFEQLNRRFQSAQNSRRPINSEVIQVAEGSMYLSPVLETAEVQQMINSHNLVIRDLSLKGTTKSSYGRLRIKRTVFYTGYLISNADSSRLIRQILNPMLPFGLADSNDLKYMANSILITPRPAPRSILDKVGGIGKKLNWQVTGTACFENRVWAARLTPVPATEKYYTENPHPVVVLAVRKGARPIDAGKIQNWHPLPADKTLTLETVVGEKVVLRVEEENPNEGEWESQFLNKSHKRRHQQDRDEENLHPDQMNHEGPPHSKPHHTPRYGGNNRHHHDDGPRRGRGRGGRGSAPRGRSHQNRGNARGRGRGRDAGPPAYRSLDDYEGNHHEEKQGSTSGGPVMNY
ncbi:hypothetical protein BO70DRAFT_365632 [Aspergillus heteromorphus CBS 117.55]|uniref:Swiss Army Knife RNA repair protein HAD domain-containing protein n=1 Tax=Aspergillus heteromorphus CBS 117.55 TaxID=1448321 RepID=A0A317V9N6_9EURO|nr:uncharacterized protein BO70DRAFT_365632 [Aspergillus heteromorphus CBS 117.55]PWY69707.1 hypothetical protein BO70DRAFT_365632 [Aspergillus heteromorphus CBS 117.55]